MYNSDVGSETLEKPNPSIEPVIADKYDLRDGTCELDLVKSTPVYVSPKEPINLGQESKPKQRADIVLVSDTESKHLGKYIRKDFGSKELALKYLNLTLRYKRAGIPVPSTVRYQEDGGSHYLVITDLTADGSEVWSFNNSGEELLQLHLDEDDIENIHYQLNSLAETAGNQGLLLYEDNYFLIRKPDQQLQVILGDIGKHLGDVHDWPGYSHPAETARSVNEQQAGSFESYIRSVLKNPSFYAGS